MNAFWSDSIELMLLGMGTVFVFLSLLVVGVSLMSAIINKLKPIEHSSNMMPPTNGQYTSTTQDTEIAAVAVSAWIKSQNH